ncbi:hypothetical protein PF011_g13614 [Phytophthora fragariae]|uniref:Uncharacterized protein n=1 Tax=Phytophthora fragariae TaxID=53985 RepID=A0A6A3KCH0_9STRA|nr:hypothetical protein PF011_g13614 [Phytophthora fragariae]
MSTSMPVLRTPGGTRALLNALGLTERVLQPFCVENGRGEDMFAPVVCLLTEENEGLFTKQDVTKAMNRVCDGAGSRFFYKFKTKRKYGRADFIDEHWDGIDGLSCRQCDKLPSYRTEGYNGHSRIKWKEKNVDRIRVNCREVYRPLKTAMKKELQFVRFIPKPHKSGPFKYGGLVAGVSTSGVFCGMYVVNGYWPYNGRSRSRQQR